MASRWNYKISSHDHDLESFDNNDLPFIVNDIQMSGKNSTARLKDKISNLFSNLPLFGRYLIFMLPLITALSLVYYVNQKQSVNTYAGSGTAKLYFQTNSASLSSESSFKILVNTDAPLGFVKIQVNFDKNQVNLSREVDASISPLKRIIQITPMSEANTTGSVAVVLGLEPSSLSTPPNGSFEIVSLYFSPITTTNNINTAVSFNVSGSQLVGLDLLPFTLQSTNLSLVVNPLATSTPTVTATSASTSTPVATISSSSTPKATSTPQQTPNCNSCQRNRCDKRCTSRDDKKLCPDCL